MDETTLNTQMDMEEQTTSVPKSLNYSDVVQAGSPSGEYTVVTNLPNNGGNFKAGQTINIAVNVPVNSFADLKRAYLKYTIKNTDTSEACFLDKSVGGVACFDAVKVLSPTGGPLSDIQHYNALCSLINDYTMASHADSVLNIREGSCKTPLTTVPLAAAYTKPGSGTPDTLDTSGRVKLAAGGSESFVHKLHGGLFNADRLIPLGFINGQLQIQIQLAQNGAGVLAYKTKTNVWEISGVELHIPVVKTGEEFNQNLRQLMGSGVNLNIHMKDWVNQQATISAGSESNVDVLLANRKRSVDAAFVCLRKSSDVNDIEVEGVCGRKSCGISGYQFSVAGIDMPSKQIVSGATDFGEVIANTELAFNRLGSELSGALVNRDNYRPANDRTSSCPIAYCLDMETYKDKISGKNLSSAMPLIFKSVLGSGDTNQAGSGGAAVLLDCFTKFDSMLTLSGLTGSLTISN